MENPQNPPPHEPITAERCSDDMKSSGGLQWGFVGKLERPVPWRYKVQRMYHLKEGVNRKDFTERISSFTESQVVHHVSKETYVVKGETVDHITVQKTIFIHITVHVPAWKLATSYSNVYHSDDRVSKIHIGEFFTVWFCGTFFWVLESHIKSRLRKTAAACFSLCQLGALKTKLPLIGWIHC